MEILRAFAAVGVVVLHVGNIAHWAAGEVFLSLRYFRFEQVFVHFAVPLFALISGFVLGLKYRNDYSIIDFYKKRAISIIPPYLIFSLIYTAYRYFSPNFYRPGLSMESTLTISDILFYLATGKAITYFWFFVCIVQLYLLYPFLIRVVSGRRFNNKPVTFLVLILLIDFCWYFIKTDIIALIRSSDGFVASIISVHVEYSFISLLLYFVIGIYMSNDYDSIRNKLKKLKVFYIYLFFFLYAPFEIYYNIHPSNSVFPIKLTSKFPHFTVYISAFFKPVCLICVMILLYKISVFLVGRKGRLKQILMFTGRYAFGIYLIHYFIIRETASIIHSFYKPFHLMWEFYMLILVIAILLSIGSIRLISYIPYSKYLIGSNIRNRR